MSHPKKIPTKTQPSSFRMPGVGPQIAKQLARLNIFDLQDVLFHMPARYQDRSQIQRIRDLKEGEEAVVEGTLIAVQQPTKGRTKLLCVLQDASGKLTLRFFHHLKFQSDALAIGTVWRCYGQPKLSMRGFEIMHPEFKVMHANHASPIEQHLTPFYPATEGLGQYMLRKITSNALTLLQQQKILPELLPDSILHAFSKLNVKEALHFLHRPPSTTSIPALMEAKTEAHARLIFEELIAHRLGLLRFKDTLQAHLAPTLIEKNNLSKTFLTQLPFALTAAQTRVHREIAADLARDKPMLRLVQGDVGSGKTVVAALAILQALENGYQAALMAPTALLAEQHYRHFKNWLAPLGIEVIFFTGSVKGKARRMVLESIATGGLQVIIGTHALFQAQVQFKQLGLIVIDEQHRFGVEQRALLRDKGASDLFYPHQLVMTATPIPRTLAMSFYANIDLSTIDELPPGRTPIITSILHANRRNDVVMRIREASQQGKQAYWVCTLIEESETLTFEAATATAVQLQQALPQIKIGLIHGRMSATEKEASMRAFQAGEVQVLVATTVIEVGVDVPNASIIVIENAERLGLSQLHQLRGRVGRGAVASFCLLLYQDPLSALAKERLAVMRETTDGFKIAERDLTLRGPGDILGTQQTGALSFLLADLMRDSHMLPAVQRATDALIANHPDMVEPLIKRWMKSAGEYGQV